MSWIKRWSGIAAGQFAFTVAIHLLLRRFPAALAENAVTSWIDDRLAEYFGIAAPTAQQVSTFLWNWVPPFLLAAVALYIFYKGINSRQSPSSRRSAAYESFKIFDLSDPPLLQAAREAEESANAANRRFTVEDLSLKGPIKDHAPDLPARYAVAKVDRDSAYRERDEAWARCRANVRNKLAAGTLVATGFEVRKFGVSRTEIDIPAGHWSFIDFGAPPYNHAEGHGLKYVGIKVFKNEASLHSEYPRPVEQIDSPLQIEVGEHEPFFHTTAKGLWDVQRTFNVKLSNNHVSKSAELCELAIISIEPSEYNGPWSFPEIRSVAAGGFKFIPLATYGEAREPEKTNNADSFFTILVGKRQPSLPVDRKYELLLRATAHDMPPRELRCKLWVDEKGRFRIANV